MTGIVMVWWGSERALQLANERMARRIARRRAMHAAYHRKRRGWRTP